MSAKNIYNVPANLWNQLTNDERKDFNYKFLGGVQNKDIKYSEIFNPNLAINANAGMYAERLPSHAYLLNALVRVTDPVTGTPEFYVCHTPHTSGLTFVATNWTLVVCDNNVDVMLRDTTAIGDAYFRRDASMTDLATSGLALNQFVTNMAVDVNALSAIILYDGSVYHRFTDIVNKLGTWFTITDNYDGTYTRDRLLGTNELAANINLAAMGAAVYLVNKNFVIHSVGAGTFTIQLPDVLLDEAYPPLVYDVTSTITISNGTDTYVYTDLTAQIAAGNILVVPGMSYMSTYVYTIVNDPAGNAIPGFDPSTAGGFIEARFSNRDANLSTTDIKNIKTYRKVDMKQIPVPGIVTGTVGSEINTGVSIMKKFWDVLWNDLIKQTYHRVKTKGRFNI